MAARFTSHPSSRFQMVRLEERIAPSAIVLDPDLPEGQDAHVVITPSGNVNGSAELTVSSTEVASDFHLNPQQL